MWKNPSLKGPVWLLQPIPYFGENLKGDWRIEPKIDGWRLQILRYKNGKYELWGRRLDKNPNWTDRLGWIISKKWIDIPKGTLIDAELYSSEGRRLIPSLFAKNKKAKPIIFVFDVIFLEGKYVGNNPLYRRKEMLENMKFLPPFYRITAEKLNDLDNHLEKAFRKGYEGIILKEMDSLYPLGKDGPLATHHWRKIKKGSLI